MNIVAKIGEWVKQHQRDLWVALCIALVGWSAYNLGQIYAPQGAVRTKAAGSQASASPKATQSQQPIPQATTPKPTPDHSDGRVFASKNSTAKKYYYPWCSSRVKEVNKIWITSESAAQAKGYTLASGCH